MQMLPMTAGEIVLAFNLPGNPSLTPSSRSVGSCSRNAAPIRPNAADYFNPSTVMRNLPKRGVKALFELPKIKKKYAALLEEQARFVKGTLLDDRESP